MITDEEKSLILTQYYDRGILKKEIRSYEVSLWTLQDRFITVLKWSDVEQKGRIENPKMTLNIDGTSTFKFSVPMYYRIYNHPDYEYSKAGELVENPNWSTIQEPNVIKGLRKIKVIFNKSTPEQSVFEFIITNVLENHEGDVLTCEVECEGLAFQELGKIGYKINLSMDNFELVYTDWLEHGYWTKPDGSTSQEEPLQTVDYWCEEAGLVKLPIDTSHISSRTWYYDVRMSWTSMQDGASRATDKVYEEPYVSSWDNELYPLKVASYTEKARTVSIENSNLYNITQTIAEQFQIYCRYEYLYDDNYNIIGRVIVFYNNFFEENKPALSLQYPYSARQTERTINSADVTTKLYVLSVDNDVTLDGANTIMNAPANGSREDYILNFDYMYKIGAIDKDQYDAIKPYEVQMRRYNDELIDVQQRLTTLQKKETELAAKRTVAANSVDLDNEQILQNSALYNALDATDREADGYVPVTAGNADYLILLNDEAGRNYVNLKNTNKGIKEDSIAIYKTLSTVTNSGATLSDQITHFSLEKDSYNNLTSIIFTVPSELMKNDEKVGHVYLTYKYKPELYYDNVIKIWKIKMAQDNDAKNEYTRELGPKSATESGYDLSPYPYGTTVEMAYNQGIYKKINDCINTIEDLQREKKKAITAFERLMGPALREGYWQPDNYSDYGDHKNYQSLITQDDLTIDTDTGAVIAWDSILFDEEDKLYYQIGIDQATEYYPCIDLSGVFSNNIPSNLNEYSVVWKATAYGNYDWNDIQHLGVAAVGSKAMIRFIKINDAIKPVLMIESAKNFNATELERLIVSGSARLERYATTVDNSGAITVSHGQTQYSIGNNWLCFTASFSKPTGWTDDLWNKYTYLSDRTIRPMVYPRIKISSLALKTDTINLSIKYNNNLLDAFADYYINTRDTERNSTYFLEYYITIKPEVLIKFGLNHLVDINYVISNANTAIYLDALKVSKENAKPKVSYNVGVTLLNLDLTKTLYNKLAQIVMINDAQLKLEDAFGYISGLELDLDAPQNDSVEVQNYTTKFEDLFSTIVAQTEEMKRMGNRMSATVNGNTGLSSTGIEHTLTQNEIMLAAYLDSHFDSSEVVRQKLHDLFTEAGEILANSNSALNKVSSLTEKNASILSGFAANVAQELSVSVFESANKPTSFKPGDIWIDNEGNHYVATGSSATSGTGGTAGFVRTYDGTLASMEGAALNVNADDGEITIKAVNNVSISSADVNIVGNRSVNIGGTTINIAAESNETNAAVGGINLVATKYDTTNIANSQVAKILIHPEKITMAGSIIEMYTGTASTTSAIKIDGTVNTNTPGIWIGSNKSVELYSGVGASTGSSVSINPTHIIMGVVSGNNASVFELKPSYLVMAVGTTNSDFSSSNVTVNASGSLTGMKLTKESFGLAIGADSSRAVILANSDGITVGTGSTPTTNGSYVTISGSGVDIGSLGKLYVNMTNFKLQTDDTYGTRFAVGSNLNNVNIATLNSTDNFIGLVYNRNGLYINGIIYASGGSFTGAVHASSFELTGDPMPVSYINDTQLQDKITTNTTVSTTASLAQDIQSDVSPIVAYGMIGRNENNANQTVNGISYNNDGYPQWNSRSYGLILGNSTSEPLLIGSNSGIHVVNVQNNTQSTAVVIDQNGIDIATGGDLKVNANSGKFIINSATPQLYMANNATWANATNGISYNGTNLEIKGSIIATGFSLSGDTATNAFKTAVNNAIDTSGFTTNGVGWAQWPNNSGNYYVSLTSSADNQDVKGILIGVSESQNVTQHLIVPYNAGSQSTVVDISRDGIKFDAPNDFMDTYEYTLPVYSSGYGWEQTDNKWWYKLPSTYNQTIHNNKVKFAEYNGYLYPYDSWGYIDGSWYLFDSSGYIYTDCSQTRGDAVYNFSSSGALILDNQHHIYMDENGIDIVGSRIKINGNDVWARDDIVIMKTRGAAGYKTREQIEAEMASVSDWILIQPSYGNVLQARYYEEASGANKFLIMNSTATVTIPLDLSTYYFASTGSGDDTYKYTLTFYTCVPGGSDYGYRGFFCELKIGSTVLPVRLSSTSDYTCSSSSSLVDYDNNRYHIFKARYHFGSYNNTVKWTFTISSTTNLCPQGDSHPVIVFHQTSGDHAVHVQKDVTFTASANNAATAVPCAVYYYP